MVVGGGLHGACVYVNAQGSDSLYYKNTTDTVPPVTREMHSPIHAPAVARESTAMITPCSNLKPRVVVP